VVAAKQADSRAILPDSVRFFCPPAGLKFRHKPNIIHLDGHFYGQQLCLAERLFSQYGSRGENVEI